MSDNVSILKGPSSCDATSIPRPDEAASDFGDWACGEPLKAQHVILNFTPSEEGDTEEVQQKCLAFWDFVSKCPELEGLMVLPDLIKYPKIEEEPSDMPVETLSLSTGCVSLNSDPCPRTALSILEIANQRGMVSETLEGRLLKTSCSLGSREYRENESTAATCKEQDNISVYKCKVKCKSKQPRGKVPRPSAEVTLLNKTMQLWDHNHPKSMDPPGCSPQL